MNFNINCNFELGDYLYILYLPRKSKYVCVIDQLIIKLEDDETKCFIHVHDLDKKEFPLKYIDTDIRVDEYVYFSSEDKLNEYLDKTCNKCDDELMTKIISIVNNMKEEYKSKGITHGIRISGLYDILRSYYKERFVHYLLSYECTFINQNNCSMRFKNIEFDTKRVQGIINDIYIEDDKLVIKFTEQ